MISGSHVPASKIPQANVRFSCGSLVPAGAPLGDGCPPGVRDQLRLILLHRIVGRGQRLGW